MTKPKKTKSSAAPHPPSSSKRPINPEVTTGPLRWLDLLLRPHIAFALLALVFGSAFIIYTPPFQVADESAHIYRAFSLAEFNAFKNYEANPMPTNIDSTLNMFAYLFWRPQNKVNDSVMAVAWTVELDQHNRKPKYYNSATGYFYPSYMPQISAVWIAKFFELKVLAMLYLGRFFALIFYVAFVFSAIRIIPFAKYMLMGLALMPMSLAQAGSYSADCVLFSFSFLCTALFIKYAKAKGYFTTNPEAVMGIIILSLMGVLKSVYFPIALLVFLVPHSKFTMRRNYLLVTLGTVIAAVALTLLWQISGITPLNDLPPDAISESAQTVNSSARVMQLIRQPTLVFDMVHQTLRYFGPVYFKSTIGILGYLDTTLPSGVYTAFTLLILTLTMFEGDKKDGLLFWQRSFLLFIGLTVFLANLLAMYILATSEKSGLIVEGIQGRYFIPVLFPVLLGFHALLPMRFSIQRHRWLALTLYGTFAIFLMIVVGALKGRYYL